MAFPILSPFSPIAIEFTPLQQSVVVTDEDASGLDVTTPAWFLSGKACSSRW